MIHKPTPRLKQRKPLRSRAHLVPILLRAEVLTRDNFTCRHCLVPGGHLDVHHKRARSQGGSDRLENLVALHRQCHRWLHENPAEARRLGFIEGNKQ
jgi:5-methylcytosine-specific restriction endonuclease McrA